MPDHLDFTFSPANNWESLLGLLPWIIWSRILFYFTWMKWSTRSRHFLSWPSENFRPHKISALDVLNIRTSGLVYQNVLMHIPLISLTVYDWSANRIITQCLSSEPPNLSRCCTKKWRDLGKRWLPYKFEIEVTPRVTSPSIFPLFRWPNYYFGYVIRDKCVTSHPDTCLRVEIIYEVMNVNLVCLFYLKIGYRPFSS